MSNSHRITTVTSVNYYPVGNAEAHSEAETVFPISCVHFLLWISFFFTSGMHHWLLKHLYFAYQSLYCVCMKHIVFLIFLVLTENWDKSCANEVQCVLQMAFPFKVDMLTTSQQMMFICVTRYLTLWDILYYLIRNRVLRWSVVPQISLRARLAEGSYAGDLVQWPFLQLVRHLGQQFCNFTFELLQNLGWVPICPGVFLILNLIHFESPFLYLKEMGPELLNS